MTRTRYLLILLLIFILPLACAPAEPTDEAETLPLEACQLSGNVDAMCGTLTVAEDRSEANGRTIDLNVAVLPADSSVSEPDPVFLLAGGPGQAATEAFPPLISLFNELNQDRDLVLVDQRGTGESAPLTCPQLEEVPVDITEEEVIDLLEECRQELAETADLSQYTTAVAMADLDAVREALGYDVVNLVGTSYGTRAALTYLALYPERVRSLVLNGVAAPELALQLQAPRDGQRALEMLFDQCAADAACSERFPDPEATLETLRAELGEGQAVTLANPLSGEVETYTVSGDDLMQLIFNILYSADIASTLPMLLDQAKETGDVSRLVGQGVAMTAGAGMAQGMFYAVSCTEDAPYVDMEEAETLQAGTDFPLMVEMMLEVCETWPRGDDPVYFRQLEESDVPALLLSGEADPITPPRYAELAAAYFPNSQHIRVPGYGHDVLSVPCMAGVVADFISGEPDPNVDAACLDEVQPPPFFVSPAGPKP